MRKHAFSGILAAVALAASVLPAQTSQAKDDFSALLSDLTFKNAVSQHPAARVADAGPALELPTATPTEPVGLELPADNLASVPPEAEAATSAMPEQVDAPTPVATHGDAHAHGVVQENGFVSADTYNHVDPNCSSCESGCDRGCGGGVDCTPYVRPVLPSSSFYQYWRSNACNTRVWDGYRNHCCAASEHTSGRCDCFKPKKSCGAGSCDIAHPVDCGPAPASWTGSGCDSCGGH